MDKLKFKNILIILIGVYCGTVILDNIRELSAGTPSKYIGVLLLVVGVIYWLKTDKVAINVRTNMPILIFGTYWLIEGIRVYSQNADWLRLVFLFIVYIICVSIDYTEKDMVKIENIMIFFAVIFSLISIYMNYDNLDRVNYKLFLNYTIDPNVFCFTMLIPYYVLLKRLKKVFSLNTVMFAIVLVGLLATGSRGGNYSVIVGTIVYFFIWLKDSKKHVKVIIAASLLLVVVAIMYPYLEENLSFVKRLSFDTVKNDGGSGRVKLWVTTISEFMEFGISRKIFGTGLSTFIKVISENKVAHNFAIQSLVEGGFVGLAMYICVYFSMTKQAFKKDKRLLALVVMTFCISMTLEAVIARCFWNTIMYIMISKKRYDNKLSITEGENIDAKN